MQNKKHTIHNIFWAGAAISFGVASAWMLFGGIHQVSAFLTQKESDQFSLATAPAPTTQSVATATPVVVNDYHITGKPAAINADSYLVADIETGEILIEENADTQYPIASITKLMTAMVAYDHMDISEIAIVSRDAATVESSRGGLIAGEKLRVLDLLYPLLLVSSNNAAEVIAEKYGYEAFITQMNKQSASLGLRQTVFDDPSGLARGNQSTARELFTLLKHVHDVYPEIIDITTTDSYTVNRHTWNNINRLKKTFEFRGGKTGYTNAARYTSAAYYSVPVSGNNRYIAIIILQSDDRTNDIEKILNYVKKNAEYRP